MYLPKKNLSHFVQNWPKTHTEHEHVRSVSNPSALVTLSFFSWEGVSELYSTVLKVVYGSLSELFKLVRQEAHITLGSHERESSRNPREMSVTKCFLINRYNFSVMFFRKPTKQTFLEQSVWFNLFRCIYENKK